MSRGDGVEVWVCGCEGVGIERLVCGCEGVERVCVKDVCVERCCTRMRCEACTDGALRKGIGRAAQFWDGACRVAGASRQGVSVHCVWVLLERGRQCVLLEGVGEHWLGLLLQVGGEHCL